MFNRRHLRIKALQAVYNYTQKEKVALQLGLDAIDTHFTPNFDTLEEVNHAEWNKNKKIAKEIFEEQYNKKELNVEASEQIRKSIISAKNTYLNYLKEEQKGIQNTISNDVLNIKTNYFWLICFLEDLSKHIEFLYENNDQKRVKNTLNKNDFKLGYTSVFEEVRKVDEYVSFVNKHKKPWQDDDSLIKNFYRETLIKDEKYQEYLSGNIEGATQKQKDAEVIVSIVKRLLWKNATLSDFFEELDPFWDENKGIITDMLIKSFKKIKRDEGFEVINLSPNWDVDYEYLMNLYKKSVEMSEGMLVKIQEHLLKWDVERLSMLDRNIIQVAITEMIECPSIPIKVTIDEFLEIAKDYSSLKSKQFINGVLDPLAKDLLEAKVIRKSGRGLIDNK